MPDVISAIKNQLKSGRIPNVWLFIGEPGTGKTSLSYILAKEIQGEDFDGVPDIEEINGADSNGIDDMRVLISKFKTLPFQGTYRSFIINEIQRTTDAAQQALLAPLEDKDSSAVLFLTTTDPSKINGALLSRCGAATYKLKGLDSVGRLQLIKRALEATGTDRPGSAIVKLIEDYDITSGRDIINMVEGYANGQPLLDLIPTGEADPIHMDIAKTAVKGQWNKLSALLKTIKPADAKGFRIAVSGVFRWNMLTSNQNAGIIADTLKQLAVYQAYEAGVDLSALVAILYGYCTKFNQEK